MPRHVFPFLLKGVQDHLSSACKRNRAGRANRLDAEILAGLPSPGLFPARRDPDDQGAFVVGFCHQDADLPVPRARDETVRTPEGDTGPGDDGDE